MDTINQNYQEELFKKAIEKWGVVAQTEMLMEESIELALALRKYLRKKDSLSLLHVGEEIADVEIMISQIKLMNQGLSVEIEKCKLNKLERLERRINASDYEGK